MKYQTILQHRFPNARPPRVWVFIPYETTPQGIRSQEYDTPDFRQQLDAAFGKLGLPWIWQPVTNLNSREVVRQVVEDGAAHLPIVLNLCDGDDVYGFPGVSVVKLLDEHGLIYTGAYAPFYEITTCKIPMKAAFVKAGVSTAPFEALGNHNEGICERLGTPLIVKPDISGGSYGITVDSVVHSDEALERCLEQLREIFRKDKMELEGVFAERFIDGPEFTVLVVGTAGIGQPVHVFPPAERAFDQNLPPEERFLAYERYWAGYIEGTERPEQLFYTYRLARPEWQEPIRQLVLDAYTALGGSGYARVDLRMDARSGRLYVLEVNAQCGISGDEESSCGSILRIAGSSFPELLDEILADALFRFHGKPA